MHRGGLLLVIAGLLQVTCAVSVGNVTAPPPPPFHGYITLAQYVCDDFLCPDWSLSVTRLATECYTWNCSNEEFQETTLIPKSPREGMSFAVYTAFDATNRIFYVAGIYDPNADRAFLYGVQIADNASSSVIVSKTVFLFPAYGQSFISLEVHPLTGTPIGLYTDGTVSLIDPKNGSVTVVASLFPKGSPNVTTTATTVNRDKALLYINYNDGQGGNVGFITVDLRSFHVAANVALGPLPWNEGGAPKVFEMNWIPQIENLVVFATGQWDQLLYVNPVNGNTSYAIFELDQVMSKLRFCKSEAKQYQDDLWKNSAYDPVGHILYFQATQGSCVTGDTTLVKVGPFNPGPPQTIYIAEAALQPLDFGYQGMHYTLCNGTCPT